MHIGLGNIGSGHPETSGDKRRNQKRVPQKNEKSSRNQALLEKSHQMDEHLSSRPCNILGTVPKMDKGGTQTNGPKMMTMHENLHLRDDTD